MLMATIDGSITLISLPDIFRGINIDPLQPGNSFYLLWMILGFLVVTSVLVTTLGRLGDIYGRVRMYNLGFAVFTFFSLLLTVTWTSGHAAGIWLIVLRLFQGVGAAMLMANSAAILTDAFPPGQRGHGDGDQPGGGDERHVHRAGARRRPGADQLAAHLPGLGAHRAVRHGLGLPEAAGAERAPAGEDRLAGQRHLRASGSSWSWSASPTGSSRTGSTPWAGRTRWCISCLAVGVALLIAFGFIETRVAEPMFRLQLFKIRAFTAGVLASFLAALSRGGLMFMLIIWLQGIWLPLHGYDFARTPLWAGLAMLPLTAGFLIAGPLSGILSDRFGARPFATGGMIGTAVALRAARAAAGQLLLLGVRAPAVLHRAGRWRRSGRRTGRR